MAFGKEIKRLRKASNIPAVKIAGYIGVPPDRLYKWEQNDLNPKDEDTIKIERVFGMDINKLMSLEKLPKFKNVPTIYKEVPDIYESMGMMETRIIKLEAKTSFLQELLQASILGKANNEKLSALLAGDIDEAVSQISVEKAKKVGRKK
jgi:transcriptional regulator with XRE-family HTH domain